MTSLLNSKKNQTPKLDILESYVKNLTTQGHPQCVHVAVFRSGRLAFKKEFGVKVKYFDLASLTKILVINPLVMKAISENKISLKTRVDKVLHSFSGYPVGAIRVGDLLRHRSGLVAHRKFYLKLKKFPLSKRRSQMELNLKKEKTKDTGKSLYSDLDYILLGWMMEKIFRKSLDHIWELKILSKNRLRDIFFNPDKTAMKKCALGARHTFRGNIHGVVDDDNCWSFGGVSGHAGLFGDSLSVAEFGNKFLENYLGKKSHFCRPKVFKELASRAVPKTAGDWAYGFMIPSRPKSSGGSIISLESFGHTGWTGTSLWVDTKRKAVVVILANRTYPYRYDFKFRDVYRPKIHDLIWGALDAKEI